MSRVFLLEPTQYSLDRAKKFGEICVLFGDETMHSPTLSSAFVEEVREKLHAFKYNPADDYIALAGRTINIAMFASIAAATWGWINLIAFDNEARDFRIVEVNHA